MSDYSGAEIAWYIGGFLAWTPAYVMVIWIGVKQRRLEIPVIAATGNIAWEFIWGWFFHVDMGYGLQNIAFKVQALKGYISIESAPGKGTTISIAFKGEHIFQSFYN